MKSSSLRQSARRLDRFVVPLQQALRVGEAAILFRVRCRREEENLGPDVFRADFAALNFRGFTPELGRLDELEIADHQPIQLPQAFPLQRRHSSSRPTGFSPMTKYPFTLPSAISATVFMCEWSPVSVGR